MKALRVSRPRGHQRSTYWLSLPYRYSIPLTVFLVLMHFFLSQTIDISRIEVLDSMGRLTTRGIDSTIMFNGQYMIAMSAVGIVLAQWQFFWGLTKFDNHIPYHKNSSAMISALCHINDPYKLGKQYSRRQLRDVASKPLTWGVTRTPIEFVDVVSGREEVIPGHCSFSVEPVELPICGMRYE